MSFFDKITRLHCSSLEEIEPIFGEPAIYEICIDGVVFEVFSHLKQKSPNLYIYGQSAVDLSKHKLPVFHRWSWAIRSPYSGIVLNDPTLYLEFKKGSRSNAGWFQGTENNYYLPIACQIVLTFAKKIKVNPKNLLFIGSSAGGFTSLMMSAYIRGSSAFVVNPQTDLLQYDPFEKLLDNFFSGISLEEAKKKFYNRFSCSEYYRSVGYIPNIYYLQNGNDFNHFKNHYMPFIQKVNEILEANKSLQPAIHTEIYSGKVGHTAPSPDVEIQRINLASQLFLPKILKKKDIQALSFASPHVPIHSAYTQLSRSWQVPKDDKRYTVTLSERGNLLVNLQLESKSDIVYITSGSRGSVNQPPEDKLTWSIEPKTHYRLCNKTSFLSGNASATLWFIEYSNTKRLTHSNILLDEEEIKLDIFTHQETTCFRIALRFTNNGLVEVEQPAIYQVY